MIDCLAKNFDFNIADCLSVYGNEKKILRIFYNIESKLEIASIRVWFKKTVKQVSYYNNLYFFIFLILVNLDFLIF